MAAITTRMITGGEGVTRVCGSWGSPVDAGQLSSAQAPTTEMLLSDSLGFFDELPPLMASIEEKFNSLEHTHILEKAIALQKEARESIELWNVTLEKNIIEPPPLWDPADHPSIPPRPLRLLRELDKYSSQIKNCVNDRDRMIMALTGQIGRFGAWNPSADYLELCLYLDRTHTDFTEFLRLLCYGPDIDYIRVFINDGRCDLQAVYDSLRGISSFYRVRHPGTHTTVLEMFEQAGCKRSILIPKPLYQFQRYATTGN